MREYSSAVHGVACNFPRAKRGRSHGVAPARRLYRARGPSVFLPLPTVARPITLLLEIGDMTTTTNTTAAAAPGATQYQPAPRDPVDREAIGRRLAEVAWHPSFHARDAAAQWLTIIEGLACYLCVTADPTPGGDRFDLGAHREEVSALGDAIVKASQIASILVDAVAEGAQ